MSEEISFLILANNEAKTIKNEIKSILKLRKKLKFKLIIVQDGSTDGTYEILNNLREKNIKLFNQKKRMGYYKAFLKGVELSEGSVIFFSDTGNKYNYSNFIKFYRYYKKSSVDLLACYRVNRKDKLLRRMLTFFYTIFINTIFLLNYKDYDCGFKIFNKFKLLKVLQNNSFNENLITSQIFLYFIKYNFKILQCPVVYKEKKNRSSRGVPTNKILKIAILSIFNLLKIRLN
ncbi:glycosyltransferase [Candidatus Pelagibacter sp.]|nr:glycosyltransferase [Candidatus Pelagibacter sp.]